MGLMKRVRKDMEQNKKREILEGSYPKLEKYRNKEFLNLGFPEMYLLATKKYYMIRGESSEILSEINNMYGEGHATVLGFRVVMWDREKAETLFEDNVEDYNLFEEYISELSANYYQTSKSGIRGVAYNIYKNIKEDELNLETLYYMLEVINNHYNLWTGNDIPEVMINPTKSFKDVMKSPHIVPKIEKVDVDSIEGDLTDLNQHLSERVKDLEKCVEAIDDNLKRRRKYQKTKTGKKGDKERLGDNLKSFKLKLHTVGSVIELETKRIKNNPTDLESLDMLNFLENYRGQRSDLTTVPEQISIMVKVGLPKQDSSLLETSGGKSGESGEENMSRLKVEFQKTVETEQLKYQYVRELIGQGMVSRNTYYEQML